MRMCLTAPDSQTRPKCPRPPPRLNAIDKRSGIALPHGPRGKIWSHRTVLIAFISFPHGFFLLLLLFPPSGRFSDYGLRLRCMVYVGTATPKSRQRPCETETSLRIFIIICYTVDGIWALRYTYTNFPVPS